MQQISKIIKSKYPPKDKDVIWIDTTGETPVQKVWDGKWKAINGTIKVHPNKAGDTMYIYPDMYTDCGELDKNYIFALNGKDNGKTTQHYFIVFDSRDTYTLLWPNDLIWLNDEVLEETEANKHYEVSILNGYASYVAFDIPIM